MAFDPTAEQQQIVGAAGARRNVVVTAGAGAGKTSTMQLIAEALSSTKITYIAYNRAAADDARARMPRNVRSSTAHGLAYRAMVLGPDKDRWNARLNAPKVGGEEVARQLGIRGRTDLGAGDTVPPLAPKQLARIVTGTVERFCHSADRRITWRHVPIPENLQGVKPAMSVLWRIVPTLAQQAWDTDLTSPYGRLPYGPDHYLKRWHLSDPEIPTPVVILDEAQDANPVMASIVWRQLQAGRQVILVGDSNQAIYGWRGAVDAMAKFAEMPGFVQLELTQSFRFGPLIADQANRWLRLLSSPLRVSGFDQVASVVGPVTETDAVLCRSNAGALEVALQLMADGKQVALVGGAGQIKALALAALDLQAGRGTDHPDLFAFATWQQVQEYADQEEGWELSRFVRLVDQHGAQALVDLAGRLVPEDQADTVVSTAHKAKGREWPVVQIHDDFREPRPDEDVEDLDPAELMLAYVAVTRAREVLDPAGLAWISRFDGPTAKPRRAGKHTVEVTL
jgi:hypothetical protein